MMYTYWTRPFCFCVWRAGRHAALQFANPRADFAVLSLYLLMALGLKGGFAWPSPG